MYHLGVRRGIPNHLMRSSNHVAKINVSLVPSADEALRLFTQDGGDLTLWSLFGTDPLAHIPHLRYQRQEFFNNSYPDFGIIFNRLVNGDTSIFQHALKFYIDITETLAHNV